jgi:hypothetical protein
MIPYEFDAEDAFGCGGCLGFSNTSPEGTEWQAGSGATCDESCIAGSAAPEWQDAANGANDWPF